MLAFDSFSITYPNFSVVIFGYGIRLARRRCPHLLWAEGALRSPRRTASAIPEARRGELGRSRYLPSSARLAVYNSLRRASAAARARLPSVGELSCSPRLYAAGQGPCPRQMREAGRFATGQQRWHVPGTSASHIRLRVSVRARARGLRRHTALTMASKRFTRHRTRRAISGELVHAPRCYRCVRFEAHLPVCDTSRRVTAGMRAQLASVAL